MARAVLFDLFGTLVAYCDVEAGTRKGWGVIHKALTAQGLEQSYEDFAVAWQRQFVTPLASADDCDPSLFVGKLMRLQRFFGLPEDRAVAQAAAEGCLDAWGEHVQTPADALQVLRALRPTHKLALVTNFDHPSYVRALLEQHDLARWFDAVIISAELRIDKPDPRIFWQALELLDVAPHDALMVGDSVDADIAGAQAAGCQAVLIDRLGWHPDYDGARIATLSELLALA